MSAPTTNLQPPGPPPRFCTRRPPPRTRRTGRWPRGQDRRSCTATPSVRRSPRCSSGPSWPRPCSAGGVPHRRLAGMFHHRPHPRALAVWRLRPGPGVDRRPRGRDTGPARRHPRRAPGGLRHRQRPGANRRHRRRGDQHRRAHRSPHPPARRPHHLARPDKSLKRSKEVNDDNDAKARRHRRGKRLNPYPGWAGYHCGQRRPPAPTAAGLGCATTSTAGLGSATTTPAGLGSATTTPATPAAVRCSRGHRDQQAWGSGFFGTWFRCLRPSRRIAVA